jgi:hypothetical protein
MLFHLGIGKRMFVHARSVRRQHRRSRSSSVARRRPWWRALDVASAIEVLEDRTLLSGTTEPEPVEVVLLSDLATIEVAGAGQFGSNPGVLVDFEDRFALTFDTGTRRIGGFVDVPILGEFGAELRARLHGILGFDVGFFIDSGSVNAEGRAQVSQMFTDPIANGQVDLNTEILASLTDVATFSPQFGAFIELVAGLGGSVNLSAALGGDRFSIGTPNGFGGTIEQELLAFNRDYDGQLRTLGERVTLDPTVIEVEVSKKTHPVEVVVGAEITPRIEPLGVDHDYYVKATPRDPRLENLSLTSILGGSSLSFPVINLGGQTTDQSGFVTASDSAEIASAEIDLARVAAAILPVPGPVGTTVINVEVAGVNLAELTVTPLSFFSGPGLDVSQTWETKPTGRMTYHFDRPVSVIVDGQVFPELQTVTFDVGQDVRIQFRNEPILVTPEWTYALEFTNDIDLELDLTGTLTILEGQLDIPALTGVARDAVEELFGVSLPLKVGPLLERDFKFFKTSFDVFEETFNLVEQTFALPSFVIGGNANPDLNVTSFDEEGKSLRSAIVFSIDNPP